MMRNMKWLVAGLLLGGVVSAGAVEVSLKDVDARLQVYGYIRADVAHDQHSTFPGELAWYVLPKSQGYRSGKTHFTARETRIGLNVFAPSFGEWTTMGKLELDFYGGGSDMGYTPRIRLAYVDLAHSSGFSVRAGQDWETFIEVPPRIVNFATLANAGALGLRRPQVRVTQEKAYSENGKWVVKAALARTIGQDLDEDGFDDGANAEWPTFQFNVGVHQRLWCSRMARVAISGHAGRESLETEEKSRGDNYDTWSVQGSVFLPLTATLAVQGNVWAGENLDVYYGGIGQGVNLTERTGVEARGGWAQLLWDPCESWSFTLGYSMDDPDDDNLSPGMRSKNELGLVNAFYKLTPAVTLMGELSRMKTGYLDGDSASNNRAQVAVKYTF